RRQIAELRHLQTTVKQVRRGADWSGFVICRSRIQREGQLPILRLDWPLTTDPGNGSSKAAPKSAPPLHRAPRSIARLHRQALQSSQNRFPALRTLAWA